MFQRTLIAIFAIFLLLFVATDFANIFSRSLLGFIKTTTTRTYDSVNMSL